MKARRAALAIIAVGVVGVLGGVAITVVAIATGRPWLDAVAHGAASVPIGLLCVTVGYLNLRTANTKR